MTTYHVSTYYVAMNITLSVDGQIVARARKAAEAMGKSLNQAIRDHLADLAGEGEMDGELNELRTLSLEAGGRSGGRRLNREELHGRS